MISWWQRDKLNLKKMKKDILQVLIEEVSEKIEPLIKIFEKQEQQVAVLETILATFFFLV